MDLSKLINKFLAKMGLTEIGEASKPEKPEKPKPIPVKPKEEGK